MKTWLRRRRERRERAEHRRWLAGVFAREEARQGWEDAQRSAAERHVVYLGEDPRL